MDSSVKSTLPLEEVPKLTYNHSTENISNLIQALSRAEIEHATEPSVLASKSSTKHSSAKENQVPEVVFYPKSTEEVSTILKHCHERSIAVTSFGGGTSLSGALAATRGGVCVDFKYMDSIVELHEDDMDIVVQPNVGWVELNRYLEPNGLFFPPDPAPGAKIGGMVSLQLSIVPQQRLVNVK